MSIETPEDASGSPLPIRRIATHLEETYGSLLDLSDPQATRSTNQQMTILTRALAAHSVATLAEVTPKEAANSVTDGYDDRGIDAVYYSRQQDMIFVVQSKWNTMGTRGVDEGDILKLCSGFRQLLNGSIDTENTRLKDRVAKLLPALRDPQTQFTLVVSSTAAKPLAPLQEKHLDNLLSECDGSGNIGLFHRETLDTQRLYNSLLRNLLPKAIDLDITLHEWGRINTPIQAAYGQIELSDVLGWNKHGLSLFHKNLRNVVHASDVRSSICATLKNSPEKFWYFNNGATLLCDSMSKTGMFGDKREKGIFVCKGASVVNGAQTIGAIWDYVKNGGTLDPRSKMTVRLIALENCPDGFQVDVTRATNTQQRIELKDFVALDPTQHRLSQDMVLGKRLYVFRSGDPVPPTVNGCTFEEAATALACGSGNSDLAVIASKESSRLWADIHQEPYTKLFPPDISAEMLWRSVRLQRAVISAVKATDTKDSRTGLTTKYGDMLTVYCVFQDPELKKIVSSGGNDKSLEAIATTTSAECFSRITQLVNGKYQADPVQTLFKNFTKCREIVSVVLSKQPIPKETANPHAIEIPKPVRPVEGQRNLFGDDA